VPSLYLQKISHGVLKVHANYLAPVSLSRSPCTGELMALPDHP